MGIVLVFLLTFLPSLSPLTFPLSFPLTFFPHFLPSLSPLTFSPHFLPSLSPLTFSPHFLPSLPLSLPFSPILSYSLLFSPILFHSIPFSLSLYFPLFPFLLTFIVLLRLSIYDHNLIFHIVIKPLAHSFVISIFLISVHNYAFPSLLVISNYHQLQFEGTVAPSDERVIVALEELQDLKSVWVELSKIWEQIDGQKDQPWLSIQPRKVCNICFCSSFTKRSTATFLVNLLISVNRH